VEDIGDWTGGGPGCLDDITVNFPIDDLPDGIQIDPNGDIIFVGEGGQPTVEIPGGKDYVLTDGSTPPKKYHIGEDGTITELGEEAEGGTTTANNTEGVNSNGEATSISAQGVEVTFTALLPTNPLHTGYGFDAYQSSQSQTKELYRNLGTNYYMPYKAVAKDTEDYIVANLSISNDSIQPQDIIFKTKNGVALTKVDSTATSYTLKLKGTLTDADVETQAVVKQGGNYQIAGAFIQYQSAFKEVAIVLVNTNNTNTQSIKEIKDKLKAIYQQAMVTFNITEINNFTSYLDELTPDGTIQSGESGFAAQYTSQQREINDKLKAHLSTNFKQNAYYLILTDKTPSTAGEKGLMPIGRQFGYIYNTSGKTPAHELAHGAFQLKHPFSTHSYGWSPESTNWLLDYRNGEHLPYAHWKNIHNPSLRIGIFDSDGEGESTVDPVLVQLQNLSFNSGVKHFAIKHCDECQPNPQPIDGNFISINDLTQSQVESFISINNIDNGILVGYEIIFDSENKRCFILYYKEDGSDYDNSININSETFNITKGLWFISYDYGEQVIDCTSDINESLTSGICSSVSQVNGVANFSNNSNYLTNLIETINECLISEPINDSEILTLLQDLDSLSRENQQNQFYQDGKVYKATPNGQLEIIENPLIDDQIENGEWTDESIDQIFRVYKNPNNNLQFKSIGIRNGLELFTYKGTQRTADLKALSKNMKEKGNQFLGENNVSNINDTPQSKNISLNHSDVDSVGLSENDYADGEQMNIDESVSFFKIIYEGGGLLGILLKTGNIEEGTYLESTKGQVTIHGPPIVTGATEAGVRAVTDITGTVVLVYDLAVSQDTRDKTWNGLKTIKDQIAQDPSKIWPMLGEALLEEASGNSIADWDAAGNESTDFGKRKHIYSKGITRTTVSIILGGKFITKLPEIAANIVTKIKRAKGRIKIKDISVDGLSQALQDNLDSLLEKIKNLPNNGIDFLNDFADATTQTIEEFLNSPSLVDAWRILKDGGRSNLRKNLDALKAVRRLRNNPDFVSYIDNLNMEGINDVDDFLAKVQGWGNNSADASFVQVLDNMENLVNNFKALNVVCNNCEYLFKRFTGGDLPTGANKQASYWIMEDLNNNIDLLNNKTIDVELPFTGLDNTTQRIDVNINGNPDLNIEYKWLASDAGIPKDVFIREFVKRDLLKINSLDELQWRIKWNDKGNNKLTKEKMIEHLSSNQGM
jgi:hypothetical protein